MLSKKTSKIICSLLILVLIVSLNVVSFSGISEIDREEIKSCADKTIEYYHENFKDKEYKGLMDWPAVGLSGFGEDLQSEKWTGENGNNAVKFREEEVKKGINLTTVKNTDFQRTIIGITAVGENPRNFGGKNLVEIVKNTMLPNGHFADSVEDRKTKRPVGNILINAHCFGVISLYTAGEVIPNRDKCLEWLIDKQHHDGGFTWDVKTYIDPEDEFLVESDIDMTAAGLMTMGILGLDEKSIPVKKALDFLKKNQIENGGFKSWGTANPESCAWAIQGLYLTGQNPMGDEWTTDNGKNPVTALIDFQLENGSFAHVMDEKDDLPVYDNGMSTEQGLYGMAAAYSDKSVYQIQHEKYKNDVAKNLFKDINEENIYYDSIIDCVYNYRMKGYNDGTFKPENNIPRVKFIDAVVKTLALEYTFDEKEYENLPNYYGDLSESQWGWNSVRTLIAMNVLEKDKEFLSNDGISKSDAFEIINKLAEGFKGTVESDEGFLKNGECAQIMYELKEFIDSKK